VAAPPTVPDDAGGKEATRYAPPAAELPVDPQGEARPATAASTAVATTAAELGEKEGRWRWWHRNSVCEGAKINTQSGGACEL